MLLASLAVRSSGDSTDYRREAFGALWTDTDRNGCDTRNDLLARDLSGVLFQPGHDCVVVSGHLVDPYTGVGMTFAKERASEVQIDHVVALSDAWRKGASGWSVIQRREFANDPLNLLAVGAVANQSKSDHDAASWLPGHKAFHCAYVARQVAVKHRYALAVTPQERDALATVLSGCEGDAEAADGVVPPVPAVGTPPPSDAGPVLVDRRATPGPPAAASVSTPPGTHPAAPVAITPAPSTTPGGLLDYGTCTNALAHGEGPYYRGQPGYDLYRDADADGVVCER